MVGTPDGPCSATARGAGANRAGAFVEGLQRRHGLAKRQSACVRLEGHASLVEFLHRDGCRGHAQRAQQPGFIQAILPLPGHCLQPNPHTQQGIAHLVLHAGCIEDARTGTGVPQQRRRAGALALLLTGTGVRRPGNGPARKKQNPARSLSSLVIHR